MPGGIKDIGVSLFHGNDLIAVEFAHSLLCDRSYDFSAIGAKTKIVTRSLTLLRADDIAIFEAFTSITKRDWRCTLASR